MEDYNIKFILDVAKQEFFFNGGNKTVRECVKSAVEKHITLETARDLNCIYGIDINTFIDDLSKMLRMEIFYGGEK